MATITTPPSMMAPPAPLELPGPPGVVSPASEGEGMGIQDVMRILKQRRWTIIITGILTYMLVVAGTLLTAQYFPAYSSEAIFELQPPMTKELRGTPMDTNPTTMEQMLQTEANKLRGMSLMYDVVEDPKIKQTEYYRWYSREAPRCAEGLQKDLSASPIPDTRLIRVALATRSKAESKDIVQKVVETYMAKYDSDTKADSQNQTKTLRDTVTAMASELDAKRKELANIRLRSDVSAIEAQQTTNREYITKLKTELATIESQAAAVEAEYNSLISVDPGMLPLTAEQQLIVESDPILRLWRNQVESLDVEIQALSLRVGRMHRSVRETERRREGFFTKEVARREELMNQVRSRQIETIRQGLARLRNQQFRLLENLNSAEAQQRDLDRHLTEYNQKEDDVKRLNEQMVKVEGELRNAETESKDESRRRLRLVQAPREAVKPSRPNYWTFLGGGAALALALGVGLAFLREFTDKAVRTPVDVARYGHLSVLGTIPQLDDEQIRLEDIEHAVRMAPHSLIAESYRKVRTNLQFSGPADQQRSLLITSPSPGDGKTSASMNLAVSMAHAGQRVLLIDSNFRRPAIREKFSNTRIEGLSNILTGQGKLEDLITATDMPNLHVLSSGPMPPRPAELLGSPAMRDLLAKAESMYDRVIFDGPPALLISDAIVLAMLVDGVILVARAETNTKGALKRAREQLLSINARIHGAILNGVKAKAGGYFRQQYRDFYDYYSDDTIPNELPEPKKDA